MLKRTLNMGKKLYKALKKGWPKLIEIGKCDIINQINHPKRKKSF
jgi:hypothetical protein